MLKFSGNKDALESMPESDLKENEILERYNLQKAIVNSWEAFVGELGMPELFLVGQEIKPHEAVRDSIDILAFDSSDGTPVVMELKRSKDKLQLLQAITYAAMISAWSPERFVDEARRQNVSSVDDLVDSMPDGGVSKKVRIILVAEKFDPEVIIASDWLLEQFNVEISAFGIDVFKKKDEIFLSINQKFPLPELHESYVARTTCKTADPAARELTWDEVAKTLKYSWGAAAIKTLQRVRPGNPDRRRFSNVRTGFCGFDWITVNMRREYVNVYIRGLPDGAETLLKSKFKEPIVVTRWRDGYSFHVRTQNQFEDLLKWLEIESEKSKASKAA